MQDIFSENGIFYKSKSIDNHNKNVDFGKSPCKHEEDRVIENNKILAPKLEIIFEEKGETESHEKCFSKSHDGHYINFFKSQRKLENEIKNSIHSNDMKTEKEQKKNVYIFFLLLLSYWESIFFFNLHQ